MSNNREYNDVISHVEYIISKLESEKPDRTTQEDLSIAKRILSDPKRADSLSASKRYLVDPDYSRDPIAICDNLSIGLPVCSKGEGKYCYCKKVCESQTDLFGSGHLIPKAKNMFHKKSQDAIEKAHEEMDEYEGMMNGFDYDEMIRRILE